MKILQVSTWDNVGGAGKAAYRLNQALNESGIDSSLLSAYKTTKNPKVIGPESWIEKKLNLVKIGLDNLPSVFDQQKVIFNSYSWLPWDISKKINEFNPDIVHLHWVGGGFLRPESLIKIKAPIVWTFHDQWPLLGSSHYKLEGNTHTDPIKNNFFLNKSLYARKKQEFAKVTINTIAPSEWLHKQILNNNVNLNGMHKVIPNCIDTNKFSPINKNAKVNKSLILYIAMNAERDPVKGYDLLMNSLMNVKSKATLIVLGAKKEKDEQINNVSIRFIPTINSEAEIIDYYRKANLTVLPSLIENLPYTAMESMSCGTPVLGFDVGGNSDLIKNSKTGFLIKAFDKKAFGSKIDFMLNSKLSELSTSCASFGKENFSYEVIAKKHIHFYKLILESK